MYCQALETKINSMWAPPTWGFLCMTNMQVRLRTHFVKTSAEKTRIGKERRQPLTSATFVQISQSIHRPEVLKILTDAI